MSKKQALFEYYVAYIPSDEERKKGETEKLVLSVRSAFAASEQAIVMAASREIPDEYADKLDRLEVRVRPF